MQSGTACALCARQPQALAAYLAYGHEQRQFFLGGVTHGHSTIKAWWRNTTHEGMVAWRRGACIVGVSMADCTRRGGASRPRTCRSLPVLPAQSLAPTPKAPVRSCRRTSHRHRPTAKPRSRRLHALASSCIPARWACGRRGEGGTRRMQPGQGACNQGKARMDKAHATRARRMQPGQGACNQGKAHATRARRAWTRRCATSFLPLVFVPSGCVLSGCDGVLIRMLARVADPAWANTADAMLPLQPAQPAFQVPTPLFHTNCFCYAGFPGRNNFNILCHQIALLAWSTIS
eukprot:365263-Chlamydomonas_euryale.AAC.23